MKHYSRDIEISKLYEKVVTNQLKENVVGDQQVPPDEGDDEGEYPFRPDFKFKILKSFKLNNPAPDDHVGHAPEMKFPKGDIVYFTNKWDCSGEPLNPGEDVITELLPDIEEIAVGDLDSDMVFTPNEELHWLKKADLAKLVKQGYLKQMRLT